MSADGAEHEDDCGLELEMPFLAVRSKGGPLDDEAYVCGYEAGRWDIILTFAASTGDIPAGAILHEENAEQIDLIAMRHGYVATVTPPRDGWVLASFKLAEI